MVEEVLSLPPVIHHFIHQSLAHAIFSSPLALSRAALSLFAAYCPPCRTLHKLARDSGSFSFHSSTVFLCLLMIGFSRSTVKQQATPPIQKKGMEGKWGHPLWGTVRNLNFQPGDKTQLSSSDMWWSKQVLTLHVLITKAWLIAWQSASFCTERTQDEAHINNSSMAQIKCKLRTQTEGKLSAC